MLTRNNISSGHDCKSRHRVSVCKASNATNIQAVQKLPEGVKDIPEDVAPLFTPFKVGCHELTNRMVLPPLTRCRATGTVPQPHMAEYYKQRAFPGSLLIAEGTIISKGGAGFPNLPGIYTQEQVAGWGPVVRAVKDAGAVFFCQLWHLGRASHSAYQEGGAPPVSSSALAIKPEEGMAMLPDGTMAPYDVPRALDAAGIAEKVAAFRQAARNALNAGFDGVEIHGANGYLIDQFTKSSTNNRTDQYGGCIENRCRFALEVVAAVAEEIGADRVGIRLSPFNQNFLGCSDATPYATFTYLIEQLNKFGLAFIHVVEPRVRGADDAPDLARPDSLVPFRSVFTGPFIAAGGFTRESGAAAVASGHTDLVAYGRHWLANPDLPKRFLLGAPLNKYNRSTFYSQGMEGYLDYPFLDEAAVGSN